jgi:hypothetical protein
MREGSGGVALSHVQCLKVQSLRPEKDRDQTEPEPIEPDLQSQSYWLWHQFSLRFTQGRVNSKTVPDQLLPVSNQTYSPIYIDI